jgi:hypothetical protein
LNVAGSGRNRGRRRRFAREQQRSPWSSKRGPRLQGLFVWEKDPGTGPSVI